MPLAEDCDLYRPACHAHTPQHHKPGAPTCSPPSTMMAGSACMFQYQAFSQQQSIAGNPSVMDARGIHQEARAPPRQAACQPQCIGD